MNWIIYCSIQLLFSFSSSDKEILVWKLNLSHTIFNLIYIILGFFMIWAFLLFNYFNIALQLILILFVLICYLTLILMEEYFIHYWWIKQLFLYPPHSNYDYRSDKS
jgi:hypothetical protein